MAYDHELADRIAIVLEKLPLAKGETIASKKMFGGLCFTLDGNMLTGVGKGELMIRLAPEEFAAAREAGRVKPMDFTGRPLKGFAYVELSCLGSDLELLHWIERSADFVRKQPKKAASKK